VGIEPVCESSHKPFPVFAGILQPITRFLRDKALPGIRNPYPNPLFPGPFHAGPITVVDTESTWWLGRVHGGVIVLL
jgi:hypothetical protein